MDVAAVGSNRTDSEVIDVTSCLLAAAVVVVECGAEVTTLLLIAAVDAVGAFRAGPHH